MARMILVWLILTVVIGVGIAAWRRLSGQEQWKLTKYIAFATMCSLVAVISLSFFVLMF